tara:strand:+ start:5249 stop:5458 length:210 start_codon:yes stop_codon:yes gene_type:complete
MINYADYGSTLYDFDYMNALRYQMLAEARLKPQFGAYQAIKAQYNLSGNRKSVLSKFETLIDKVYQSGL